MFTKVYSLYSAFYPSLQFTLSLHFTPGPQSAVRSPQSAFYTDRLGNTLQLIFNRIKNILEY